MMQINVTEPSISYLLGLLHTDGSHHGDIDHKGRVTLELSVRDSDVLRTLVDVIPFKTTLRSRTRVTNFSGGKPYTCSTLCVFDREFRRWLATARMPPGRKSLTVGPPVGPFCHRSYLRGIIDGDGSVGFTRTGDPFVSFVTASQDLAEFFAESIWQTSRKSRTLRRNRRDNVFNVMVINVSAALLAEYVWPSEDVLGIARKRTSGRLVAQWRPPAESAGRYGNTRKKWTPAEDQVVLSHTDGEAAAITGRTTKSVSVRRWRLLKALAPRHS
jgi:hypothetical protein